MKIFRSFRDWSAAADPCAAFGALYGAVVGGAFMALLMLPGVSSLTHAPAPLVGGALGALWGAAAGFVTGAIGALARNWWGWGIAGLLGGCVGTLPFLLLLSLPPEEGPTRWVAWLVAGGPPLLGAVVGSAVGSGIERGHSSLPRVNCLLGKLAERGVQPDAWAKLPDEEARTHLLPAATPTSRGDELTPAP